METKLLKTISNLARLKGIYIKQERADNIVRLNFGDCTELGKLLASLGFHSYDDFDITYNRGKNQQLVLQVWDGDLAYLADLTDAIESLNASFAAKPNIKVKLEFNESTGLYHAILRTDAISDWLSSEYVLANYFTSRKNGVSQPIRLKPRTALNYRYYLDILYNPINIPKGLSKITVMAQFTAR
jgi:hypothetical protein